MSQQHNIAHFSNFTVIDMVILIIFHLKLSFFKPKAISSNVKVKKDMKGIQPKRPLTAFILFSNATRQRVRDENPGILDETWNDFSQTLLDLKLTDISRELGLMWKDMSDMAKKVFLNNEYVFSK